MTQDNPSTPEAENIAKIESEVARYLASRSGAADTLEGVVRWWIMQQRLLESERLVREAILALCAKGKIKKRSLPDGTDMFYSTQTMPEDQEDADNG